MITRIINLQPYKMQKIKRQPSFCASLKQKEADSFEYSKKSTSKKDEKNLKIIQINSDIQFKKASTLKNAVKFGRETFGIEAYVGFDEEDVNVINWINEALTNASNFLQGKIRLPKKFLYAEMPQDIYAGVVPHEYMVEGENIQGYFAVNKNFLQILMNR